MTKKLSILKYAPLAVVLLAMGVQADTIHKEFNVSKGGLLTIETDVGAIEIESHNKNTVLVEVHIDGRDEDKMVVDFKSTGDDVIISGELERNGSSFFNGHSRLKVKYTVTVPQQYNLDLNTSGGHIDIENLDGEIDARTSGGSISLTHVHGDIDVKTSGGAIDADDVTGKIIAHTSGGSIRAKLLKSPEGDSKFSTSGGSISAYLAKDIAVELYAKTSGGRVSSELDVNGSIKKRQIKGSINGGGPDLIFKTSGGSIHINEL
ncbi:MAG: hypothetical protein HRT37_04315 [Alteromonadaceae bacterium]|nr:hypothetical protein [Alteromonadaceae bacterium]